MDIIANFENFLKRIVPIATTDFAESIPYFKVLKLRKGELFLKPNEVCTKAAYINKGILRSFYENEKGQDITYCFCSKDHVGTSVESFTTQTKSNLAVEALEHSELLIIEYSALQELYANSLFWQTAGRIFMEKAFLFLEKYASSLNNEPAKERYLRLLSEQPDVIKYVQVQHIASYLGISRETLSRISKQVSPPIL